MKKQTASLVFFAFFAFFTAFSQNKGYMSIMQSPTATTATYDGAKAKMEEAGIWNLGWTFHAVGAMQPAGLLSIGVYPDKASADNRIAKNVELFKANNINAPAPEVLEIYNIQYGNMPAVKPATAILAHFNVGTMTVAQYDMIMAELQKIPGALGNPANYFHMAFKRADGNVQVIDLWESAEKFQEFGKTLMPVLTKVFGEAPQPPAIYSLYNTAGK